MKSPTQYDELWDAFKGGSQTAFSSIYQRYARVLFLYGSKICSDKGLVEDSVQDLFVELWNGRKRVARTTSVKFYLFKALRYKIYRNIDSSGAMECLDKYLWHVKNISDEEAATESGEVFPVKRLRDALAKLPARQREAINLRYYQKFSNEEIAAIMNITYRSACKCIYAGLKNLNGSLKAPVADALTLLAILVCLGHMGLF